jgi:hypothetical protein
MNNEEAIALLEAELDHFRRETHADLANRIGTGPVVFERDGASGAKYQIEIDMVWDDGTGGNIRVLGSIDDGGWRAFKPLCRDFIKAPDGSFVGE